MLNVNRMAAIMDAPTAGEAQKLPDMVMCGDHPSFTKTELNAKEVKMDDKEKEKVKEKPMLTYPKITPKHSRTESLCESRSEARGERLPLTSEHALRLHERRRRDAERQDHAPGADTSAASTRSALHSFPFAAMGSFRWPPYLLAVWVMVLVLTHVLHCLVNMLEKTLPALKKCTNYFRAWTEETWRTEQDINHKLCPVGLAAVTGVLYVLYFGLYSVYAIVVWSIEPLYADAEDPRYEFEPKVTDYIDVANSKTNASLKQ